jgi:malonyl-CoA/methylmalonyl-CoA synthetase
MLAIIENAKQYATNTAIVLENRSYTYSELLNASASLAAQLLNDAADLNEARVAFMVNAGFDYVTTQWAIWRAGGVAVPLCLTHPFPSIQYVLEDTDAAILVVSKEYAIIVQDYCIQRHKILIVVDTVRPILLAKQLPNISPERNAMILYTSGTTNKPKGVVTTHTNIHAQINSLINAWQWSYTDRVLCVLPLHHVHGIINVVSCALYAGATCQFLPTFSAKDIFDIFMEGHVNVFMAVPTIYFKLINYWETLAANQQTELKNCMQKFRLMVCGSAALPVTVMEQWQQISGQILLERYGMTEIGMAISNPYNGERKAGYVGIPLPGVNVSLVNESYEQVQPGEAGEILIKGANVFKEYWNKPSATAKEFTTSGWFKTGDIAIVEDGYFRIMGRNSVDIIKSGGYKISALEIEETLRSHIAIKDCAVIGILNDEWGELIVAALVLHQNIDTILLNQWLRERMPAYKTPRKYMVLQELPRNAMGKVLKTEIKKHFSDEALIQKND